VFKVGQASLVRFISERLIKQLRLTDSAIYSLYLKARHPEHAQAKKVEKEFYRNVFGGRCRLIFDVGANAGNKAIVFTQLAEKVICIEPSPAAADFLRHRFARNPNVTIVAKGVGDSIEARQLNLLDPVNAYNTFSTKWVQSLGPSAPQTAVLNIEMTTFDQLIKEYGTPDYIKIDVEGYELQVITGLSLPISLISFECNLPIFMVETGDIICTLAKRFNGGLFNFTVQEPPRRFHSLRWLREDEILRIVESGDFGFMEIFFKHVGGQNR
jgi:FkbM family methyltransferase